jgi:hypothetical protein
MVKLLYLPWFYPEGLHLRERIFPVTPGSPEPLPVPSFQLDEPPRVRRKHVFLGEFEIAQQTGSPLPGII